LKHEGPERLPEPDRRGRDDLVFGERRIEEVLVAPAPVGRVGDGAPCLDEEPEPVGNARRDAPVLVERGHSVERAVEPDGAVQGMSRIGGEPVLRELCFAGLAFVDEARPPREGPTRGSEPECCRQPRGEVGHRLVAGDGVDAPARGRDALAEESELSCLVSAHGRFISLGSVARTGLRLGIHAAGGCYTQF